MKYIRRNTRKRIKHVNVKRTRKIRYIKYDFSKIHPASILM